MCTYIYIFFFICIYIYIYIAVRTTLVQRELSPPSDPRRRPHGRVEKDQKIPATAVSLCVCTSAAARSNCAPLRVHICGSPDNVIEICQL